MSTSSVKSLWFKGVLKGRGIVNYDGKVGVESGSTSAIAPSPKKSLSPRMWGLKDSSRW